MGLLEVDGFEADKVEDVTFLVAEVALGRDVVLPVVLLATPRPTHTYVFGFRVVQVVLPTAGFQLSNCAWDIPLPSAIDAHVSVLSSS